MILPVLALITAGVGQASAPDPAVLAYMNCVSNGANEAEAQTRGVPNKPAPDDVFDAAEARCQPLYQAAISAFYATTMKTDEVQAYVRGKDENEVRAEVEAGLRDSLRDRILTNISLLRSEGAGNSHAQH